MDKYFVDVIKYLIMKKTNKNNSVEIDQMRIMRSLAKSMRMDKGKYFPQKNLSKILEIIYFQIRFWGKSSFPNDVESSWEEVKSWEKQKAALKIPK